MIWARGQGAVMGCDRDRLTEVLKTLCPMHLILDARGKITHAGPTLRRLSLGDMVGQEFHTLFELRRPLAGAGMPGLCALAGRKLHLRFRSPPMTEVKGVLAPLPDGGAVINLSFGISVADAVRDHALTHADFAPTDLTIELLYLHEAKSAAMEASQKLNLRLQGAKIAAEEQAFTDTLTGLKNRRALDHVLGRIAGADADFAILHLDLDHFKAVNDSLGHAAGDTVLQAVAKVLVDETRRDDTVARVGGDEFVLVLNRLTDRNKLQEVAERLITRLEQPVPYQGQMCRISASIGIAISNEYAHPDPARMIEDADEALYRAKEAGRGLACLHKPSPRRAALH